MPKISRRDAALAAALCVPFGLLHVFVLAEAGIAVTDLLFLAEMALSRNARWAAKPWFVAALAWWAWLVFCSTPGMFPVPAGWGLGFLQALVILRLIIFTAALESWVLTTAASRRIAWMLLALSALWIGLEAWQQYLTGHNIFGNPRWGDGALTGPFWKPRAGALYGHLLFIALLPPVLALYARGRLAAVGGALLAVLACVTSVLIGQRMGTVFTGLGLLTAAIFLPRLRGLAAIILIVAAAVVILTPIISPPTHAKLVGETSRQAAHFLRSPYGELDTRAVVMGLASLWHGWGYNGFRAACPEPVFGAGLPALGIAPTQLALGACNLHPHNFYVQSFADAGLPGLALFGVMNLLWLRPLLRGQLARAPARLGLFIGVLTFSWPLASTDAFPTLYMSGWLFFMLGLGLAWSHISLPVAPQDHVNV